MIILPAVRQPKVLLAVPKWQWRERSVAQWKDEFGRPGVQTRFRIRARLHDGHLVWEGWFDDRDDFDEFLWSLARGTLGWERELWRLPEPWYPGLDPAVVYEFATQVTLSLPGSNQTHTSALDWNNSNNSVWCIGGGASGESCIDDGSVTYDSLGGGAGAASGIANFNFATPGTSQATYRVAAGTSTATRTGDGVTGASVPSTHTWWNDTVYPGTGTDNTKCAARSPVSGSSQTGGTTAGWGQTKYAGGNGGDPANGYAGGGGGAAGDLGAGSDGASASSATNGTVSGGSGSSSGNGNNGSSGSPFGGGGGGNSTGSGAGLTRNAGNGGNYGAGGGGSRIGSAATGNSKGGNGAQGIIVVTYEPVGGAFPFPRDTFQHLLIR
jgi:hypothetical protein